MLAAQNHYTLVVYPVSYHHDTFRKGEHSLENKICFECDLNGYDADISHRGSGSKKN